MDVPERLLDEVPAMPYRALKAELILPGLQRAAEVALGS